MLKLSQSRKYLVLLLIACAPFIFLKDSLPVIAQIDAGIRIGHFAPFEAGDAAIRVEFNGTAVVDDFIYGWSTARFDYPSGTFTVEVFEIGEEDTPLTTREVELADGKKYTIMVIGDGVNQPFDIAVIDDDQISADPSAAAIAFGHFAPLSGSMAGTSIDIRKDNNILVRDNLVYGVFDPADTDQLTEATTSYIITSASGEITFVDLQTFGYNQSDLQYLILVGDGVNKPIAAYMYVNDSEGGFMNQEGEPVFEMPSISFANFYSDADIGSVQVEFSESYNSLLDYGDLSDPMLIAEGEHSIRVSSPSGDLLIQDQITVGLSETVIFAITKSNVDDSVILVPVFGDYITSPVEPPRIKFVHLAPFTSGAYSTLDVRRNNGLIIEDDLNFGEEGEFRYFPPGEYTFRYTTRNGDRTLFDPDPISLAQGDNMTIFLIGDGKGQLIRLLVHVDGEGVISQKGWEAPLGTFSIAHLAPFSAGSTSARVDFDGQTVASSLAYGDFLPAEMTITGQHEVSVYDEQTGNLLASRVVSISPSSNHTIILAGDNSNEPVTIEFLEQLDVAPTGQFEGTLRFGNYSIFSSNQTIFDGSQVELAADGQLLFDGVTYGSFDSTDTATLQPDTYEMTFMDAEGKEVPGTKLELSLNPGDDLVLLAVGDGERQPYGLFSMRADGLNGRPLDGIGSIGRTIYFPIVFRTDPDFR